MQVTNLRADRYSVVSFVVEVGLVVVVVVVVVIVVVVVVVDVVVGALLFAS